ncbi:MAG: hypothetical protein ACLFP8_06745 [Alphaproteobacteria bacterium]
MKTNTLILGTAALSLLSLFAAKGIYAQLNNKPFSFKGTPDGGVGMSNAGRQAIFNQKNFGITPDVILRSSNGELLNVTQGVGKSVVVTRFNSGEALTRYKGTSFRSDNRVMRAGAFNAYFVENRSDMSTPFYQRFASSADSVNTWTTRVSSDGYPASYSPNSVVDKWTSLVFIK